MFRPLKIFHVDFTELYLQLLTPQTNPFNFNTDLEKKIFLKEYPIALTHF